MEELDHLDSGMGSSDLRSPEVKSLLPDEDEEEDEEDESLSERLIGLTEMFPKEVRNFGYNVGSCLCTCVKGEYKVCKTIYSCQCYTVTIFKNPSTRYCNKCQAEKCTMGLYEISGLYGFSCSATWLFFSSSAILFAPVMFEVERAQMEEVQRSQQKQVLLGPNTTTHIGGPGLPLAPPLQR